MFILSLYFKNTLDFTFRKSDWDMNVNVKLTIIFIISYFLKLLFENLRQEHLFFQKSLEVWTGKEMIV